MLKKFILGIVLLGLLTALFVYNQSNYEQKVKSSDIFRHIPNSALFIVESDNIITTSRELIHSNLIVQNLKEFNAFKALEPLAELSTRFDSLFPELNELSIQGAISAHPIGNSFTMACHFHLSNFDESYLVPDSISVESKKYDEKEYKLFGNTFFYYHNQVLSISLSENVIQEIIRTNDAPQGTVANDSIFNDLKNSVGKLEKGHLFLFHQNLDKFLNNGSLWNICQYFPKNYADISAFDIRYEPNLISLAGISYAKPSNTLHLSNKQSTVELPSGYIPNTASHFNAFSFADSQSFIENYLKQNNQVQITKPTQETWAKLVYRHYGSFSVDNNKVWFIRMQNQEAWVDAFDNNISKTSLVVNGTSIYKIDGRLLLQEDRTPLYAGAVHNTLYASASLDALENSLLQVSYEHNLNTFKQFNAWYSYLSGDGNGLTGINTKKLNASENEAEQALYNNLSFILAESSYLKDQKYYQYILIGYDPKAPTTPLTVWENNIGLDSARIQLVRNHYTNNLEVAVYDTQGNLKLLSSSGKTLWERSLQEPILGKIQQVDLFKNKKLQMAFNCPSGVYLIDRLGRTVENFPIYIKQKAISGLSIADYEHDKDYRVLVANANGELLNYDLAQSKATKGWKYDITSTSKKSIHTPTLLQASPIRIKGKDYIVRILEDGQVEALSRRGDVRYNANITITPSLDNYYINEGKDIAHSAIVYADKNNLVYHYFNGKKDQVQVHAREDIQSFYPVPKSKNHDFIVLCANEVSIYSGLELQQTLTDSYQTIEQSKNYVTLKNQEGKLELLNSSLQHLKTPINYGESVKIGAIQNQKTENVISYDKQKIYCYKLETE